MYKDKHLKQCKISISKVIVRNVFKEDLYSSYFSCSSKLQVFNYVHWNTVRRTGNSVKSRNPRLIERYYSIHIHTMKYIYTRERHGG